jgi:hypothetical protein
VTVASASVAVDAIVALLRGQATPILTEVGQKPAGAGWQGPPGGSTFRAYTVLWPDPGLPSGSLGDRHADLLLEFQVTAVGQTVVQALWMQSATRAVLLGQRPTIVGRQVWPLWMVSSQYAERDDDETPPLYYAVAVYQMKTGPA